MIKALPTDSAIISYGYGFVPNYGNGKKYHRGVDIKAKNIGVKGDRVYAIDDGIVRISKYNLNGYGNYVVLEHDGYCSLYAHLDRCNVSVGDTVNAGRVIGYMGTTGHSTGVHLHFEIRYGKYVASSFFKKENSNGSYLNGVDPSSYIKEYKEYVNSKRMYKVDVDKSHWAYKAYENLNNKGVTVVTTDFDKNITRGEFMSLLYKVVSSKGHKVGVDFKVVGDDHWADAAYQCLRAVGIYIGEKRFDDGITRGEIFALLDRACIKFGVYNEDIYDSTKAVGKHWAYSSWIRLKTVMKITDSKFDTLCTRGECMALMERILEVV